MEIVGIISIWIVWLVVKCWVMAHEDRQRHDERTELRESNEWYDRDHRARDRRRIMYLKMYEDGRLYDVMTEDQVEQFVDDLYG